MAFNPRDEQEGEVKEVERPQPILHTPRSGGGMGVKLVVIVFVLAVLGAATFLVYNTFYKGKGQAPPPAVVQELPSTQAPADTSQPVVQQPAQQQPAQQQPTPVVKKKQPEPVIKPTLIKKETPVKKEPVKKEPAPKKEIPVKKQPAPTKPIPAPTKTSGTGEFTIYIGSYRTKVNAEDEVKRWNEAGYQAFLSEQGGWYRVALGRYATKEEARVQAEKLKEAFEAGYWVDKFK